MKIVRYIIRYLLFPVGYLVVKLPALNGYKKHLLALWYHNSNRSWFDNLVFPSFMCMWVRFEYLPEGDPDKREGLKGEMMGGQAGVEWAKEYNSVGWGAKDADPRFYGTLDALLASGRNILVIQLGSSSGREIQHFALRHPQNEYIGIDVFPEVVEYASKHCPAPNLRYLAISVKDIGKLIDPKREVIIFSDGTLQYVQPEHLALFFEDVARLCARIVLIENGSWKRWPRQGEKSRYRENLCFTHDYQIYAKNAGLKEIMVDISSSGGDIIHYFYYGESVNCNHGRK